MILRLPHGESRFGQTEEQCRECDDLDDTDTNQFYMAKRPSKHRKASRTRICQACMFTLIALGMHVMLCHRSSSVVASLTGRIWLPHGLTRHTALQAVPERPNWVRPQVLMSDAPKDLPPGSVSMERAPTNPMSLYHSFSNGLRCLGLEESDAPSILAEMSKFIVNNPDYKIADKELKEWVSFASGGSFKSVAEYGEALAEGMIWGNFIEQALFCQIWRVNLGIYNLGPDIGGARVAQAGGGADAAPPLVNTVRLQRHLDFASKESARGTILIGFSFGDPIELYVLRPIGASSTGRS